MIHDEKKHIVEKLFNPQKARELLPREIFNLGFRTKSEFEKYLLTEFYGVDNYSELGKFKSSFTKRKDRAWKLIYDVVKQVGSEDHFGVYALSRRFYRDILAYVTASSIEEATLLGNVMLGYLIPKNSVLEAKFCEFGSENSIRKNMMLLDNISVKLKRQNTSLASLEKERENLVNHKKTLQIIIDQLKVKRAE